jgi:hypothetical protein
MKASLKVRKLEVYYLPSFILIDWNSPASVHDILLTVKEFHPLVHAIIK